MFGKKKQAAPAKKGGGEALMNQMGLGGMDQMDAMIYGDLENDADLEAELAALTGEAKPKSSRKLDVQGMMELDRMVAASLHDVEDEDVSDTEDPDLLAELQDLSTHEPEPQSHHSVGPSPPKKASPEPSAQSSGILGLLQERLGMYTEAKECARAKGDSSKARRMDRGTKALQDLIRQAKAGRPIPEDDIPPPVSGALLGGGNAAPSPAPAQPRREAPPPSVEHNEPQRRMVPPALMPHMNIPARSTHPPPPGLSAKDAETYQVLKARGDQYKVAALQAKRAGDAANAGKLLRTAKQFDKVIDALSAGQAIDLSQMPPPPPGAGSAKLAPAAPAQASVERSRSQGSAVQGATAKEPDIPIDVPEMSEKDQAKLFKAPDAANTTMEALQQRLLKYRESADSAKKEGNGSKARRMGRIAKQYDDVIKAYKAGKPVDFEELPAPPGFPPIPVPRAAGVSPSVTVSPKPAAEAPKPAVSPRPAPKPTPSPTQPKPAGKPAPPQRQASILSRAEQQAIFLQDRQLAFKKAALQAKTNGDMELAKKYLRMAKGFDQMIEAAHSGLPVDMGQVPAAPGSDEAFEMITAQDAADPDKPVGDREEMYQTLEQELVKQIRTCSSNSEQFIKLGDISSANKFEKMGQNARKDLDSLKNAFKHGDPVPRFHYETRTFSLVQSNTELGDNDLELVVVRGLNYNLPSDYAPKDMNTYIKYEFPYPNEKAGVFKACIGKGKDDPQKGYTDTCKATNTPEYNQSFKLQINRKSRAFLRLLKSKSVKFEVYYKRGFLKSDKVLGTVNMKLASLETMCTAHESLDLMDGRKSVGGKLEVKMRIRDAFSSKQVEETKEKWLIIDHFDRALPKTKRQAPQPAASEAREGVAACSMEVLKYEKQLLDNKIRELAGRMDAEQEQALLMQSHQLGKQLDQHKQQLKEGGMQALNVYLSDIERSQGAYLQEAQGFAKQGNREKAQLMLHKKKLVEREAAAIRAKIQR